MLNIPLPDPTTKMAVDAGIVQASGSIHSADVRGDIARRLTFQVGEYVCAYVQGLLKNRKYISYETLPNRNARPGDKGQDKKKQGPIC